MRKTKLIILPTRCLNRMGFLLLFLSCPVIGDWGRIRPDTEMSQWSILLDKEGSCGLIRNSGENDLVQDGRMEYQGVGGGTPLNDTLPTTSNFKETEEVKPGAYYEGSRRSERRTARREIRGRKTASFERRNAFRYVENSKRNYRANPQEYRRRNDAGRLFMGRQLRHNNEVIQDNSRKRQKRESDLRRTENRAESRRMEERRLSRRVKNDDPTNRRVQTEMRLSRVRIGSEESRNVVERRERGEDRRTINGDRRSQEREVFPGRRRDNTERSSVRRVDMRRDTLNEQVSDGRRTAQRLAVWGGHSKQGMRRDVATSDTRRNERTVERGEALQKGEIRRFLLNFSKKQDIRAGKSQEREFREKTVRIDRYKGQESRVAKQKVMEDTEEFKWFLGGVKNWFHQKANRESWAVNNDFAATCLVGASVYLLTTLQTKAV